MMPSSLRSVSTERGGPLSSHGPLLTQLCNPSPFAAEKYKTDRAGYNKAAADYTKQVSEDTASQSPRIGLYKALTSSALSLLRSLSARQEGLKSTQQFVFHETLTS
jgi:hypothetical protein